MEKAGSLFTGEVHFTAGGVFFSLFVSIYLFTGKVVLERRKQMPDDGDAPGPAQEFLSGAAAHVGNICVVNGEAEDPAGEKVHDGHNEFVCMFVFMCVSMSACLAHLSSSVHHSMSSFPFIRTGKCWSFPCLMELERVVMVRTFPNYGTTNTL